MDLTIPINVALRVQGCEERLQRLVAQKDELLAKIRTIELEAGVVSNLQQSWLEKAGLKDVKFKGLNIPDDSDVATVIGPDGSPLQKEPAQDVKELAQNVKEMKKP